MKYAKMIINPQRKTEPIGFLKFALSLLLLIGLVLPTCAGSSVDLWMHQVPRVKTPPAIDGKTDDPCWKALPALSNFGRDRYAQTSAHPLFPIALQIGYDDTYMYVLWKLSNPAGTHHMDYAALKKRQDDTKHDTAMYWNRPSLEFRIAAPGRETMLQMNMVNKKEALQMIHTGWSTDTDLSFDLWGDYQYVSGFDENGWWVEMRVALKDLGIEPRSGIAMSAQFRYFHAGGTYFAWTPAGYDPAQYGKLILVDDPLPAEKALELIFPNWRNMTIRMPQADNVVVVERGQFTETSFQAMIVNELNGLKQKRQQLDAQAKSVAGNDAKAMFANLDKKIADLDADIGKIAAFSAADVARLRTPLDALAFDLREAAATLATRELLVRK